MRRDPVRDPGRLVEVGMEYVNGMIAGTLEAGGILNLPAALGGMWSAGLELGIEIALRNPEAARLLFNPDSHDEASRAEMEDSIARLLGPSQGQA